MIGLINFGNEDVEITKGMRIAQAIFYKFLIIDDEKKDEKKTLTKLPEHRCKRCNRLLFYGNVKYVEIKCPKCSCISKIGKDVNKICIKS